MKSHGAFYMLNFRKVRSYEAHFAASAAGGCRQAYSRSLALSSRYTRRQTLVRTAALRGNAAIDLVSPFQLRPFEQGIFPGRDGLSRPFACTDGISDLLSD